MRGEMARSGGLPIGVIGPIKKQGVIGAHRDHQQQAHQMQNDQLLAKHGQSRRDGDDRGRQRRDDAQHAHGRAKNQ